MHLLVVTITNQMFNLDISLFLTYKRMMEKETFNSYQPHTNNYNLIVLCVVTVG